MHGKACVKEVKTGANYNETKQLSTDMLKMERSTKSGTKIKHTPCAQLVVE